MKLKGSDSCIMDVQLSTAISREGKLRVKLSTTEQEIVELKVIENHLI